MLKRFLYNIKTFGEEEIPSDKLWRLHLRFTDDAKEIQFNVNRSDTISQLKTKIKKYKGIPTESQLLLFESKPLSDNLIIDNICRDLSLIVVWDTTPLKPLDTPSKPPSDPTSQFRESAQLHIDELPINKLKRPSRQNCVPIILFFNGTFCPIHAGHIHTMETAKKYLESLGTYEVLGGYISPCCDRYAKSKLGEKRVSSRHRAKMIELAVTYSDWIMTDQLQIHSRRVNPLDDVSTVYNKLRNSVPFLRNGNFYMAWVAGVDSMSACFSLPIEYSWHIVTLTVVNRGGFEKNLNSMKECLKDNSSALFVETNYMDLSSTEMRKAIKNSESLSKFYSQWEEMWPTAILVEKYISEHSLWAVPWRDLSCPKIEHVPIRHSLINNVSLSNVLLHNGFIDSNIIDFEIQKIGQGKGFRSQAFRVFNIKYEKPQQLNSFVIKFVDLEKYENERLEWNFCVAEKGFYENISHTLCVPRTPKCYFAYENKERISCIMLEDLSQCEHDFTFASGVPILVSAETLEDINIAFTAEANVEYFIYVANSVTSYVEYNIQVGYNCTLSLEQCYPYRVDAVNCKCSVNKTLPLLTTTGDVIQSEHITHKESNAAIIAGSVVGSVVFALIVVIVFFILMRRNNKHPYSFAVEMSRPLQQQGKIQ